MAKGPLYVYLLLLLTFTVTGQDQPGSPCYVGDHEDNTGSYKPHPSDCGKYLQCLHGSYTERSCPTTLHWNIEEHACDWPQKANCAQEYAPECDVGDHADNLGVYKSHPTDCGKFLKCDNRQFVEMSCASNLHWNEEEVACDWPENAKCQVGGTNNLDVLLDNPILPVPHVNV